MTRAVNTASVGVGGVIQVVQGVLTAYTTFASAAYTDSGLAASITPTNSTSKILVIVNLCGTGKYNANTYGNIRLMRDTTVLQQASNILGYTSATTTQSDINGPSFTWVDTPNTSSAVTYKIQVANGNGAGFIMLNNYINTNNASVCSITLLELAV